MKKTNISMLCAIFLFVAFASHSVRAGVNGNWTREDIEFFDSYPNQFRDTYFSTTWGSFWMAAWPLRLGRAVELKSTKTPFYEDEFPYLISLKRDSQKRVVKSDLVIFVSGMFSGPGGTRAKNLMRYFINRDYHVVYLPNPWSPEIIARNPKCELSLFECEADAIFDIMKTVTKKLKAEGAVQNIHLAAESYGTLLSSILLAKDSSHLVNGRVLMISPVLNMKLGMEAIDKMMDDSAQTNAATDAFNKLKWLFRIVFAKSDSDQEMEDYHRAKVLTAFGGFNPNLVNSVVALDKVQGRGIVPKDKNKYKQWSVNFRFRDYLKYFGQNIDSNENNPRQTFAYWIQSAKSKVRERMQIVSSKDDFLNAESVHAWRNFPHTLVGLIPGGGHSGYLPMKWFDSLIGLSWGKSTKKYEVDEEALAQIGGIERRLLDQASPDDLEFAGRD